VSSKAAALAYKRLFDDHKLVTTEVIISAPDSREDNDSADEAGLPEVQRFWKDMMARHGSPEKYQTNLIDAFKNGDDPEILIVVDKLLTGFDAPRNAVLYIDKRLREHNILQAIARVNRVFEGKDHGLVIDYRGIFGEMNEALELYAALEREGFDPKDIQGGLVDVTQEIATLPTKHAAVWDVFKGVENTRDLEAMQLFLGPADRRDAFYETLSGFAKTLQLALSNPAWQETTPDASKHRYTGDLKYFLNLRAAVKQRYAESVDYSAYEAQLSNIVANHIGADDVKVIIPLVSIFQVEQFEEEVATVEGDAAKADTIAARVKKTLTETMEEDPVFNQKLSELIQAAIDAHRAKRLSDAEYLERMRDHLEAMRNKGTDSVPEPLRQRDKARAYYGVLSERLAEYVDTLDALVATALETDAIITRHKVRDWQHNRDAQNRMLNDLDDLFHDLKGERGVPIPYTVLDEVTAKIMNIAKVTQG
jgi:type I restriction enzyme R subunit